MKTNTPCYIVNFNDWVRRACLEKLRGEEDFFPELKVKKDLLEKEKSYIAYKATIGFAREIRQHGDDAAKPMIFEVVVERVDGSLRFARASEWVPSLKKKASLKRVVDTQIARMRPCAKKLTRGRLGRIS